MILLSRPALRLRLTAVRVYEVCLAALTRPGRSAALRVTADRVYTVCVLCTSVCVQVGADVFEHADDVCRECLDTPGLCPYPFEHGVHEYRPRGEMQRVACTTAQAAECDWCHRVLDATALPCPDHREPCCGCCEPR